MKLPSDVEIFQKHILTTIIKDIRNMEALDDRGKIEELKLDFCFPADLSNTTLEDISAIHNKVICAEKDIQTVDKFLKYYRGLIYLTVHEKFGENQFLKWIEGKTNCSTASVYRYMAFTALILRFPRLLKCDLIFSQILKHKGRIINYMSLEENSKLAHQLSDPIEFRIGGVRVLISPTDNCEVPHIKGLSFNADWRVTDFYEDANLTKITPVSTKGATNIVDETVEELEKCVTKM